MKEKLAEMEAEAKKLREVQAQVEKDLSTQSKRARALVVFDAVEKFSSSSSVLFVRSVSRPSCAFPSLYVGSNSFCEQTRRRFSIRLRWRSMEQNKTVCSIWC
jgi:hypothetical protein